MSSDTLLCTGEAQFFLSRRLDGNTVDIAFHGSGKILAHLHDMRRELGRLCEYGRIQIAELPAAFAHERGNVTQQRDAVRALVARVGIWKMLADVTERERAERLAAEAEASKTEEAKK